MAAKTKFAIKNPDAPMTDRQCYALLNAVGVTMYDMDIDDRPFTVQEASDMIDAANKGKAYHVRVQLAEAGGRIARADVGRRNRSQRKPKGYAALMAEITGETTPKPKAKAKAMTELDKARALVAKLEAEEEPEPKAKPKKKKPAAKPKSEYAGLVEAMQNADPERLDLVKALFSV